MSKITCVGGYTQIGKVLAHACREAEKAPVRALVFVGDSTEEQPGELIDAAAELAQLGVPAFMFQEGREGYSDVRRDAVARTYRKIARITRFAAERAE